MLTLPRDETTAVRCRRSPRRVRRRGAIATSLAAALAATALAAQGVSWYVDANATSCAAGSGTPATPFCTINEALDAAADGDTIHIAPGTYVEQLVITKDVALVGTEGADVTIVQGPGGRVVRPWNGTNVVIDGLTITGGNGFRKGTGLFLGVFPDPPTVTLTNSTISNNRSEAPTYAGAIGGGVYVGGGSLTIQDSTVSGNVADGYYGRGGGIHLMAGTLTISGSTISGNRASSYFDYTYGGGISVQGGYLLVERSSISGNVADGTGKDGGLPPPWGTGVGGGIACIGGTTVLRNTTVVSNSVRGDSEVGSGIAAYRGSVFIDHSTISGNVSFKAAAAVETRTQLTLRNSIVWGNLGREIGGSFVPPVVEYCDVEGGWPGPGNIALDPGFGSQASGDFSLVAGSPCIDIADPSEAPGGLDLGGTPRFLDGDLDRGMRTDMGAYEFGNVWISVSGDPTPGGVLTVNVGGTPGMSLILAGGFPPGETLFAPWGSVFFDVEAPFRQFVLGTSPTSRFLPIPPTVSGPLDVVLQAFAYTPLRGGKSAGNFSNPVFLTIE